MAKTNYEFVKAWRKKNKDKVNAQARRYYARHPEKRAEIQKRHRKNGGQDLRDREAARARARRRTDPEGQKRRMAKFKARKEAEKAAVAGRPRPSVCDVCRGNHHLGIVFDHCHATDRFRGWLCDRCNKILGMVYDDPKLLKNLAKYLEKHYGKVNDKTAKCLTEQSFCGSEQKLPFE